MYPITTMYPEDPRQPFYDTTTSAMTPLAKLYIRKVKQYPRDCDADFLAAQVLDVAENADDDGPVKRKFRVNGRLSERRQDDRCSHSTTEERNCLSITFSCCIYIHMLSVTREIA